MKKRLLFVITQFYKGGAETSLLNLFQMLDPKCYEVDFIVLNQLEYSDVTSLMEDVPKWIHVYDVFRLAGKCSFWHCFWRKVYRKVFHAETYTKEAIKYIKNQTYDAAFSFGEWLSPEFVARYVHAKSKYVWIHIDLDKANFVNRTELVRYDRDITGYLFVSEESRKGSILRCPEMAEKSYIVHNFLNRNQIIKGAEEELPEKIKEAMPYLLSVGNLREEKNYPRQIEVMKLLKERNISLRWLCVGSTANQMVLNQVEALLDKYQLKDDFILCGTDDNPYKYMKNAEAVMVLSDHESWSLVISEAKILGIPVIATATSGAKEQLVDEQTGILVDFNEEHIAEKIQYFLRNHELAGVIRQNLENKMDQIQGLQEFEELLNW